MARLRLFSAGSGELKPSNEGYSAFEMEARRINPLYREAAGDYAEIGKLQRENIADRKWPLDFIAYEDKNGTRGKGRGGGIKVQGGIPNLDPLNSLGAGLGALARANAQIAAAENASGFSSAMNPRGGMLIDAINGTTMRGRQTYQGMSNPGAGGLITPPGAAPGSPLGSGGTPTIDVPAGVDPSLYGQQIGAPQNAILQQPLDGSLPLSIPPATQGFDTAPGDTSFAPGFTPYTGPQNPAAAGNFPALPPGEPLVSAVSGPNGTMIPAGTPDPSATPQQWNLTPTFANSTDTTSWLDGAAQSLGIDTSAQPDASQITDNPAGD